MNILELAHEDSLATGERFVPQCESTSTGTWCVVDAQAETLVARGLSFFKALDYANYLSEIHQKGREG